MQDKKTPLPYSIKILQNTESDSNLCIIGWNWRSLSCVKVQTIEYLIKKYKPHTIWESEAWLNKEMHITHSEYEWIQTKLSRHQGAWIIIKKGWKKRIYKNNDPYMIAVKAEINNNWIFIISTYFIEEKKFLRRSQKINRGIRRTYKNSYIII